MSDQPDPSPQGTPTPPNQLKSWLPVIAGALSFFLIAGVSLWFYTHLGETPTQAEQVTEAADEAGDNDTVQMDEVAIVVVSEPKPTPAPEATPAPIPEPATPARPAVVAVATQPEPAADPTNCTFVNGNRPQVGTKYVLTCAEGTFLATGEYKPGGIYIFSAFAPHTP